jgi:hypothetical protein
MVIVALALFFVLINAMADSNVSTNLERNSSSQESLDFCSRPVYYI